MSNFNDQLSRMKDLYKYGSVNEEAKPISTYSLEYKAKAADGRYYGIVRENSKYFVKVATPGKETIAESYQYIGGIMNKSNYEYNSYANALKQFELKLGSINEAYDENRKVNVEALDPYKKEDLVIEGTEKMKNELARQRQIMRNASVIMNEATEIGSTPFKTQPEAEHDNSGDKDYPFTKEGKAEEDRGAIKFGEGNPDKHSTTFGPDSSDVEDYNLDKGKAPKVSGSVASENPKGGKVTRVDESLGECGAACGAFNEEGDGELGDDVAPVDTDELNGVEPEELGGEEGLGDEEGLDLGDEDGLDNEDGLDLGDEDELGNEDGEDLDDDEDIDLDDDDDFDDDEFDFGDEDDDLDLDDEEGVGDEDELGDEKGLGDEDELGDEEDPEIELDENVVRKFRQLVRESMQELVGDYDMMRDPYGYDDDLDLRGGNNIGVDPDEDEEEIGAINEWNGSDELELVEKYPEYFEDALDDEGNIIDQEAYDNARARLEGDLIDGAEYQFGDMRESKKAKLNSIVESVVSEILNEDELHVFGDHPGYRKKPMQLPQTGEDKNKWGRDWNDESVHSEEPFGKGKGDSTPFDELVAQITDSVMKQVNENKKKVK